MIGSKVRRLRRMLSVLLCIALCIPQLTVFAFASAPEYDSGESVAVESVDSADEDIEREIGEGTGNGSDEGAGGETDEEPGGTVTNSPPTVAEGKEMRKGTASPADGETKAVPYTADMSGWFEDEDGDSLTYIVVSAVDESDADVKDGVAVSGSAIKYIPDSNQAGKEVVITVKANDGKSDSTGNVSVFVTLSGYERKAMLTEEYPWQGAGKEDDPFLISDADGLKALASSVNEGESYSEKFFALTDNIDLNGEEWAPIGVYSMADAVAMPFSGTVTGGGFTVSGLSIKEASGSAGLFGYVHNANILNLTVSGSITQDSSGSFESIGGIAGLCTGTTKIENCVSKVAITIKNPLSDIYYIGGIAGAFSDGGIKGCTNDADISIQGGSPVNRVGGILGYVTGQTAIDRCANEGDIARTDNSGINIGGLVGEAEEYGSSLMIKDSYNAKGVTSESIPTYYSNYTGGLVGGGGKSLSITGSHNSGPVNSKSGYTGGLVGYARNNTAITGSYNKGDVTVTGPNNTGYIGGVVGSMGTSSATVVTLEHVYNEGAVQVLSAGTGSSYTGGVAGFVAPGQPGSSITECYNTGKIKGGNNTGGVFGSLGADLGNISYCYNTGEVATNGIVSAGIVQGGVAGSAGDNTYLSYCYNTGGIISTEANIAAVGGITGRNGSLRSYVSSGFNTGKITAADYTNVGGVTGVNYAGNEKVYYSKSVVNDGIAVKDANIAKAAEPAQVTNGWLAYMLDDGGKGYFRTRFWSQGDGYPIFAGGGYKPVYKVIMAEPEEGAAIEIDKGEYVKQDESVTLTITPPEDKILFLVTAKGAGRKLPVSIDDGQAQITAKFTMPGEDVTVTAEFAEAPAGQEYTVTYHANGGSGGDEARQVAAGKRAECLDPAELGFTNADGTFKYWSLTGSGPEYDFNTAVVKDIDLYAIWRTDNKWCVTFNLSGSAAGPPPPQYVDDGERVEKPEDPIWESGDEVEMYVFDKWCKEDGEEFDFETYKVTGDITLYAKWKIGDIFAQSSQEKPAEVRSEYGLRSLSSLVNSGQLKEPVYVKICNDITLSGEWIPIGADEQHVFTGGFDGGGYTISGLNVTGVKYAGLFGYTKDSVIKNVTVNGPVSAGTSFYPAYAGGIAGYADGVIFEGCSSSTTVSGIRGAVAGGIAGYANKADFKSCSNSTTVSGINGNAGGIAGRADEATFRSCSNSAAVSGTSNVGGIAGYASLKAPAENLVNTGGVTSTDTAGGIFGSLGGSNGVSKSYNTGNVESTIVAGGIIGTYAPDVALELCYNLGNISINPSWAQENNTVGGIVGSMSEDAKVVSCYSMGKITAKIAGGEDITQNVGGIAGKGGVNIESCYFLKGDEERIYSDEGATRSIPLSMDAFKSGEAAWLLDKGDTASRTYYWSKSEDGKRPIFAGGENKPVYRMSVKEAAGGNGKIGPEGVSYYNESSRVILTISPDQGYALMSLSIAGGTGKKYTADMANNTAAFNMPDSNITVTPVFMDITAIGEGPFTVSFNLNGGAGGPVDPQTVKGGEWARQPVPDPAREDYIFAGWYDRAELDPVGWGNFIECEPFDFNTAIIKNTELVACWLPKNAVLVTFSLNRDEGAEGSKPIPPQIVQYGGKIKRPADIPTWDIGSKAFKMVFTDWFDQASEGLAWDFETPLSAEYGNALTLYAQWKKDVRDNPVIDNIEDLEELAQNIRNGADYENIKFELSGHITLTEGWIGIGTPSHPFNGTVSGGNIGLDPNQRKPLFGYLGKKGTVSGVTVEGELNSIRDTFGGIAGTSEGTVKDCNVTLDIKNLNTAVVYGGGIVGEAKGGTIQGCTLQSGSIIRAERPGGIAGFADNINITGCKTEEGTQVIGSDYGVGGIVGFLTHKDGAVTITGCENHANVTSSYVYVGGFVGHDGDAFSSGVRWDTASRKSLTIEDCVNYGEIKGKGIVGGFIGGMGSGPSGGANDDGRVLIKKCVNRGEVTLEGPVSSHRDVGGFIGKAFYFMMPPEIINSYDRLEIDLVECENYGEIKSTSGNSPYVGGFVGHLTKGFTLNITNGKVGSEDEPVTVGADKSSSGLHSVGGFVGLVDIGQFRSGERSFDTNVFVSDSSFYGTLNGDQAINANNGSLGGVIGSISIPAAMGGTAEREIAVNNVRVDAEMNGNSSRIGGAIGSLSGIDANTAYTLNNISVEGDMPDTNTAAAAGGLGGIIGQMASFAGELNISKSFWKGNFTDAAGLPHGGIIGDMGEISAKEGVDKEVNITDVFMRGDFSAAEGVKGGIIGNITKLNDGAGAELKNAYWYGAGINPDDGKGGIIGNIGENNDNLTVGNTYYGITDGTEPEGDEDGGGPSDNGITFKSRTDFERGEVSYLLEEGDATTPDGVTWAQDWEGKYPVFGERRTHRITSALLRQDEDGQLTPEEEASLVITAKSPGSQSETAYDDYGGTVQVSVVDIPDGYALQSISIAGGSPESIGNNGTFTLDGDAEVTAIIAEEIKAVITPHVTGFSAGAAMTVGDAGTGQPYMAKPGETVTVKIDLLPHPEVEGATSAEYFLKSLTVKFEDGSTEVITDSRQFTATGNADVTADIGENIVRPEPVVPDDDDDEVPQDDKGIEGRGTGDGDGTGGYGLTPGDDSGSYGDADALYPLPGGDTAAGGEANDETLPESIAASVPQIQERESQDRLLAEVKSAEGAEVEPPKPETEPEDEKEEPDEPENPEGGEQESQTAFKTIQDSIRSNPGIVIAIIVAILALNGIIAFVRFKMRKKY